MRVVLYKVALTIGDPTALDFLGVFRKTLAEGPILPHFNETSRFFWQPRHPPGLIPESWRERGIEIIADPLESENGLFPLAEHVPMESLITFHLQHNEFPQPVFFQPLFRGRTDAEIFLIQNFHVLGAIGMIRGVITFIKKEERAPISEFLESVLEKMSPPVALTPPAPLSTVTLASAEDDPKRGKVVKKDDARFGKDASGELDLAKVELLPLPESPIKEAGTITIRANIEEQVAADKTTPIVVAAQEEKLGRAPTEPIDVSQLRCDLETEPSEERKPKGILARIFSFRKKKG